MIVEALHINLGCPEIDAIHDELAELVDKVARASNESFSAQLHHLIEHTRAHFRHEEHLMDETGFIHSAEHLAEHKQMLAEMEQFSRRPRLLARAYVKERLPERFALHISRMDSLLAASLRTA
jgi:hemerythrin-like metal-binding protein